MSVSLRTEVISSFRRSGSTSQRSATEGALSFAGPSESSNLSDLITPSMLSASSEIFELSWTSTPSRNGCPHRACNPEWDRRPPARRTRCRASGACTRRRRSAPRVNARTGVSSLHRCAFFAPCPLDRTDGVHGATAQPRGTGNEKVQVHHVLRALWQKEGVAGGGL